MKDPGAALHFGAGAVIGLLAVFGIGREALQHDFHLSLHQWIEALAWPAGGFVAVLVGVPLVHLIRRKKK